MNTRIILLALRVRFWVAIRFLLHLTDRGSRPLFLTRAHVRVCEWVWFASNRLDALLYPDPPDAPDCGDCDPPEECPHGPSVFVPHPRVFDLAYRIVDGCESLPPVLPSDRRREGV